MVDVENILSGLYANEINAFLAWKRHRGFQVRLGNPILAAQSFRSSGAAARWLKKEALVHFPGAEFDPERKAVDEDVEAILDDLYSSDIDGSIEWIWDGGFYVSLGGREKKAKRRPFETVADAIEWLRDEARQQYPASEFARKHRGFV